MERGAGRRGEGFWGGGTVEQGESRQLLLFPEDPLPRPPPQGEHSFSYRSEGGAVHHEVWEFTHSLITEPRGEHHSKVGVYKMHATLSPLPPQVHYPTGRSLQVRTLMAWGEKIALSIWELGQGLEHFFDLL